MDEPMTREETIDVMREWKERWREEQRRLTFEEKLRILAAFQAEMRRTSDDVP